MTQYIPEAPPVTIDAELQEYLMRELGRVGDAVQRATEIVLDPTNVAPTKPEEGTILYADGTNFDPGSGEGVYAYINGAWVKLSDIATLTSLGVSAFIQTLLNDADATTALATLGIVAGTWTPTLANVANVAASTIRPGTYIRVGNVVACDIEIDIDPSLAAPTATQYRLSLPIASDFSTISQAHGVVGSRTNGEPGHVNSVVATDDVKILINVTIVGNASHSITFQYEVL